MYTVKNSHHIVFSQKLILCWHLNILDVAVQQYGSQQCALCYKIEMMVNKIGPYINI